MNSGSLLAKGSARKQTWLGLEKGEGGKAVRLVLYLLASP